MIKKSYFLIIVSCLILASCGGNRAVKPSQPSSGTSKGGGYYSDDGPQAITPDNLDKIPDAIPKVEALNKYSTKPYIALGKKYYPLKTPKDYKKRGIASWYGKMFHGKKTASGETYDMYSMTAAHNILPLPSYAKVTNVENGRSIIVRINDRGPFKHEREIDLSYAAAYKLRLIEKGSGLVEVETIDPQEYTLSQTSTSNSDNASPSPSSQASTSPQHYIQAGAFGDENNAITLQNRIEGLDIEDISRIDRMYNNGLYRLTVGPYQTKRQAEEIARTIHKQLNIPTIITTK
jgi:rare lipoprotein A